MDLNQCASAPSGSSPADAPQVNPPRSALPMSSDATKKNAGTKLPAVLAVGFTGHRTLPNEIASRKAIHDFLAEKKLDASEILVGVTSVASGGDLLFAESCLDLDIPLRILLPLPREEFRTDFDPTTWTRVERVLGQAMSVEVIGTEGKRDERYYECGLATVLQSQLQMALWDGQSARGLGGTEQIVSFARKIGRPVVWIHSVTGAVQREAEQKRSLHDSNRELHFLNGLGSADTNLADKSSAAVPWAWLAKLDANALLVAPQVRRLAALPILCTAMAAVISGGASRLHASGAWVAAGAVLGLTAALLPAVLRLGKRQALWVRIRTAAEITRSVCALWDTPSPYEVVGPEVLPELGGMIVSLNFLKANAGKIAVTVDTFKTRYLEERLLDQKRYFKKESSKAAQKGRRYRLISKICVVVAIALSAWTFAGRSLLKFSDGASSNTWLPFMASALFQGATIAGALLVVNDCDRRQRRYLEIYQYLANWELELRAFSTWPPIIHLVNKIERALLVELLEWRSLLQNTKMPRN